MGAKFWDITVKILSALVIPLILWGVSLEVDLAVQNEQIERLQEDVEKALAIREKMETNSKTLARLEEKMVATNKGLDEIKGLLRDR
jgi:hypothetical protein